MRKLFYGISGLLLVSSAALANTDRSPAARACSRLTPESTRDACYKLIPGSQFDSTAVAVCDEMQDSADTLDCMETIQDGKYYSQTAVYACARSSTPALTSKCLDEVADEGFQDAAVTVCSQSNPSLIGKCMQTIANREFNPDELKQCRTQPSSEEMIRCFSSSGHNDAGETLKCTPQTQNSNSNSKLQVDIEKMQMAVYHCEYIKK